MIASNSICCPLSHVLARPRASPRNFFCSSFHNVPSTSTASSVAGINEAPIIGLCASASPSLSSSSISSRVSFNGLLFVLFRPPQPHSLSFLKAQAPRHQDLVTRSSLSQEDSSTTVACDERTCVYAGKWQAFPRSFFLQGPLSRNGERNTRSAYSACSLCFFRASHGFPKQPIVVQQFFGFANMSADNFPKCAVYNFPLTVSQ